MGGAIARVPEDATAFTGRAAPWWIGAETVWDDPELDDAHIGWARAAVALGTGRTSRPGATSTTSPRLATMTPSASSTARTSMARLVALKRAWDPDNVFRLNQNIRP